MKDWCVNKTVSVVLGSYNRLGFLKITIDNVRKELDYLGDGAEIIVVDGGSNDGSLEWLIKQKDVITIAQHNRGVWRNKSIKRRSWGYFMNLGFKCAQGKYVCMVSDDCVLRSGCIQNGINLFDSELEKGNKVGAVAFYFRNWPEQEKYYVGVTLGRKMSVNHGLYLKKALDDVGYCDEESIFFCYPDGDLIMSLWDKGYSCIDSPTSLVEHYSHANFAVRTANGIRERDDWQAFLGKWKDKYAVGEYKDFMGGWIELEKVPHLTDDDFITRMERYHFFNKIRAIPMMVESKLKSIINKNV